MKLLGIRLSRRGPFRFGNRFVRIHDVIAQDVRGMEAHEAAFAANRRDHRNTPTGPAGHLELTVCLDAKPFAVIPAGRTVTIRAATLEEVLELPVIQPANPISGRPAA